MLRKTLCCLLCCIAILSLTATSGFAAGWFDGADRNGSISFDFNTADVSVTGGSVELRMVARWDDETKGLQWCEGWEEAGLSLDELFGDKAAACLFVFAETKGIPAQKVQVGSDGTAAAEDLALGVWLVSQTEAFEGCMAMLPSLISVPLEVDGAWVFDVVAAPKLEPLVPETTVPVTTMPPPPDLPPTGQTNWPIPLLILGGCFLILLGLCIRKGKRHETNS
jgi:hypothetical protein